MLPVPGADILKCGIEIRRSGPEEEVLALCPCVPEVPWSSLWPCQHEGGGATS